MDKVVCISIDKDISKYGRKYHNVMKYFKVQYDAPRYSQVHTTTI